MVRRGRGLERKLTQTRFRLTTLADNNIKGAFMKNLARKTPLFFTVVRKINV